MENTNNYEINNSKEISLKKNLNIKDYKLPFAEISKSICKIKLENKYGSGFLIKLEKGIRPFYCLMSCCYVITKNMLKNENSITVYYNNEKNSFTIKLSKNKRFNRDFSYINIDVIVIQVLPEDKVDEMFFLEPNYVEDFQEILNKKIFSAYNFGEKIIYSESKITSIKQYEFSHLYVTNYVYVGSPFFILINDIISVIGIQKSNYKNKAKNYGYFIGPIIDSIKNNLKLHTKDYDNGKYIGEFRENKREGYGKFIRNNKSYYIGQWLNDYEHGKGAIYSEINSNNDYIIYEGDFANGKLNGRGKCVYENGNYYIGQFSDGLRHGKGIIYYKNNTIKYDGDFVRDVAEGKGKYIWEDGEYYIGQFSKNLRHGKGIEYYKNNHIKYDGDFVNNKYEGNGEYIWENGNHYIGQWLKGLKNGKGIIYSKNKNIIYNGNFLNDKRII